MIPILYDKTGNVKIGELTNCIECLVEEERNGLFEVSLIYPVNDTFFNSLEEENIIVCNANDTLLNQKFRIYMTRKLMSNKIEVFARHISFDLAYDYVNNIEIEKQGCEYALNTIFRSSQFSTHYKGYSDIINAQDYKISKVNCIEAIGGASGSILDTFGTGAEILRDNTNIHVLNKRGHNNGVSIEYAKNLTGFELEEDYSELITRIVPFATYTDSETSEEVLVEANPVDSDYISNYSHPYISYMDFSEKFEDEEIPTTEKLVNLAKKYFKDNKCDKPKQNFKVEFIPLSKCVGYEGIQDNISLCDTVTIKDARYNINTKAKVIKTIFNVLKNRYESMELGEPRTTLGDIISSNTGGEDGKQGPPGPQGPPGKDGSIGDFPNSLPSTPVLSANVYGFASIELNWTYENKVYYNYELYGSKIKDFTPNTFDLIHAGQSSSFLFQVKPNETWYFRVRAVNTHGESTAFSSQVVANTTKIDDLSNYVEEASIGSALIGSLNADVINSGTIKGNYIDAKQLSVTNGNGIRTLDIDSFGNVNLNVNSLQISSSNVATENYANNQANNSLNSAKSYADGVGHSALTQANAHADNVANTAQTNAINTAKDYTNTKITDTKAEIKMTADSIIQRVQSTESSIQNTNNMLSEVSTGVNKVLFEMYSKTGQDGTEIVTIDDYLDATLLHTLLLDDFQMFGGSDEYLGKMTTHLYFNQNVTHTVQAFADDGSSIYLNGTLVVSMPTCTETPVTLNFKQGWNKIVWVYNEGNGGDGCRFTPSIKTLGGLVHMNAYPVNGDMEQLQAINSTVKTTNNRVAEIVTNLDGITQRVSSNETTIQTTNNKIDNLEVGGRNLLTGCGQYTQNNPLTLTSESTDGWEIHYNIITSIELEPGEYMFQAQTDGTWSHQHWVGGTADPSKKLCTLWLYNANTHTQTPYYFNNNNPLKINIVDKSKYILRTNTYSDGNTPITVKMWSFKLEKGNKPTAWTPAPEDVQGQINETNSRVENTSNRVAEIITNLDGITQRVSSNESTTSTLTSQMNAVDGKIDNAKYGAIYEATNIKDTRNDNQPPSWYMTNYGNRTVDEFKLSHVLGIQGDSVFGTLTTKVPWGDPSGGYPTQTFISSSTQTFERKGVSWDTWGEWVQVENIQGSQAKANQALNDAKAFTTTEVTKTNNKVAEIVTNLDSITSRVSSTESTVVNTQTQLNNLKIGGRNLIKNGSFKGSAPGKDVSTFDYWRVWGTPLVCFYNQNVDPYNETGFIYIHNSDFNNATPTGIHSNRIPISQLKKNTEYTVSYYYGREGNVLDGTARLEFLNEAQNQIVHIIQLSNSKLNMPLKPSEEYKTKITFTMPNIEFSYLQIVFDHAGVVAGHNGGGILTIIGQVQLEEGNKATEWKPSFEETEDSINNINNNLTTNYSTTSQMNSAIEQKANQITQSVSQSYATKEEVNIIGVGGTNLLLHSSDYGDTSIWIREGAWTTSSKYRGTCIYTTEREWADIGYSVNNLYDRGVIEPNTKYTFSCYVRSNNEAYQPNIHFYGHDNHSEQGAYVATASTTWKRISITFQWYDFSIRDYPIRFEATTGTPQTGCYLEWAGFKLEKGTKATDWTPAPEDMENTVSSLTTRVSTAEQKITSDAIISTVTNSSTYKNNLTGKVDTNKVVSSINQSAESVKIKANKIQLEGAVTVANKNGDSIKINNGDYEIRSDSTVKGFLGLRDLDDNYTVPRLALGQDGLLRSSNNYFVIQAYPKNNNPQNYGYPYVDIAYRLQKYKTSENVGDVSNIKMYGDGVTRLSPVKTLEITTNFKNGSYNGEGESLIAEFGSSSSSYYDKYMDIPTIRNTQTTNGLILAHRNANDQSCFVRVNCDSNGDRFFRPLTTDGNISLGSGNYQWKSVHSKTTYSSAGVIANDIEVMPVNNNDILDNINFISPLNDEEELIIDVTNIKNTNYVDSYENNVYLNNNEIIKLLLKEVKQLKEELNKLKYGSFKFK